MDTLAEGCCSAVTPCSWQRQNPTTICATCRAASPSVSYWLASQEREARSKFEGFDPKATPEDRLWHRAQAAAYEAAHAYAVARPDAPAHSTPPAGGGETEKAITAFAEAILHGDEEHRGWLTEAAEAFNRGKPLPAPRGKGTSPASPAGDLISLSAGATQGLCVLWPNSPLYLRDDTRNGWGLLSNHNRTSTEAANNAQFFAELWNAFRSGLLVEAAPTAPRKGQSEEEIARIIDPWAFMEGGVCLTSDGFRDADRQDRMPIARRKARQILALTAPADRGETQAVTNEDIEWLAREAIRTGDRTLARIAAALKVGRA